MNETRSAPESRVALEAVRTPHMLPRRPAQTDSPTAHRSTESVMPQHEASSTLAASSRFQAMKAGRTARPESGSRPAFERKRSPIADGPRWFEQHAFEIGVKLEADPHAENR